MRDHQCRAAAHDTVERALHCGFAFRVECACRFIEEQDRRIAQDGACNGNALALAAGEGQGRVRRHLVSNAVRQGVEDKLVGFGRASRRLNGCRADAPSAPYAIFSATLDCK